MIAKKSHIEGGFTLVEIIVTLLVVSIFLGVIVQTSYVSNIQHQTAISRAAATTIATSNLNKFPDRNTAVLAAGEQSSLPDTYAPFYCKPGTNWGAIAQPVEFSAQPNTNTALDQDAKGITILNNDSSNKEETPDTLVNPEQRVAIYTPNGCKNAVLDDQQSINADTLKIESTVTYGPPNNRRTVRMANYVTP